MIIRYPEKNREFSQGFMTLVKFYTDNMSLQILLRVSQNITDRPTQGQIVNLR